MELAREGRQKRVVEGQPNHKSADGVSNEGDVCDDLTLGLETVQKLADFLRYSRGKNHEGFGCVFEAGMKHIDAKVAVAKKEVV